MRYSFYHFFVHQLTDAVAKGVAVNLVGHFGDHDLLTSAGLGINRNPSAQHYPASAKMHGCPYAFHSVNDTAGWEIGRLYKLHQFLDGDLAVVDIGHAAF